YRRRDPPRERIRPRQDDRDDPRRFRHPLSVEAVQSRLPEGEEPADPALAGGVSAPPAVIPGRGAAASPESRTPASEIWIPGSSLRGARNDPKLGYGMTELIFRDDAYARTCAARIVTADERGIRLDRT